LSGQSAAEHLRALQVQWYDALTLPLCLAILALYEWWRWLFSIPSNPVLLTVILMVALIRTRQRRRSYKVEAARLKLDQSDEGMVRPLIDLLMKTGRRLCLDIRRTGSPWISSFTSVRKCSIAPLLSRLRLNVFSVIR